MSSPEKKSTIFNISPYQLLVSRSINYILPCWTIWMCADDSENKYSLESSYVHLCTDTNKNPFNIPLKIFIKLISSDYCLPKLYMEIYTRYILKYYWLNWISREMYFRDVLFPEKKCCQSEKQKANTVKGSWVKSFPLQRHHYLFLLGCPIHLEAYNYFTHKW